MLFHKGGGSFAVSGHDRDHEHVSMRGHPGLAGNVLLGKGKGVLAVFFYWNASPAAL